MNAKSETMKCCKCPVKFSMAMAAIMFLVATLSMSMVYHGSNKSLKQGVQNQLLNLAQSAALLTDGDAHSKLDSPDDKTSALYLEVQAPHLKLLKANPGIEYIFSMVMKDSKVFIVMDSTLKRDAEVPTSDVMAEYKDYTPMMKKALTEQKAMVEDEVYSDEWGSFLSAYAPLYDSSRKFVGIVGVDLRAKEYSKKLTELRKFYVQGILFALIASIVFGIFMYRAKSKCMNAN